MNRCRLALAEVCVGVDLEVRWGWGSLFLAEVRGNVELDVR